MRMTLSVVTKGAWVAKEKVAKGKVATVLARAAMDLASLVRAAAIQSLAREKEVKAAAKETAVTTKDAGAAKALAREKEAKGLARAVKDLARAAREEKDKIKNQKTVLLLQKRKSQTSHRRVQRMVPMAPLMTSGCQVRARVAKAGTEHQASTARRSRRGGKFRIMSLGPGLASITKLFGFASFDQS